MVSDQSHADTVRLTPSDLYSFGEPSPSQHCSPDSCLRLLGYGHGEGWSQGTPRHDKRTYGSSKISCRSAIWIVSIRFAQREE